MQLIRKIKNSYLATLLFLLCGVLSISTLMGCERTSQALIPAEKQENSDGLINNNSVAQATAIKQLQSNNCILSCSLGVYCLLHSLLKAGCRSI